MPAMKGQVILHRSAKGEISGCSGAVVNPPLDVAAGATKCVIGASIADGSVEGQAPQQACALPPIRRVSPKQ